MTTQNKKDCIYRISTLLFTCLILYPYTPAASETSFEPPPALATRDLVKLDGFTSPAYTIAEKSTTDGFLADIRLDSKFGQFHARGPGMLPIRTREIIAISQLTTMVEEDEALQGAQETARETGNSIMAFFEDPEESIKGIPAGVGRFFSRTARKAKTAFQTIGDMQESRSQEKIQQSAGPGSRLPGKALGGEQPNPYADVNIGAAIAKLSGQALVNALGFEDARRRIAKRLLVDPYTTNQILQEKLNDVSWAAFSGGLGIDLVVRMVPGGKLVSTTSIMSNWVWDLPPGDLQVQIESKLVEKNIPQEWVDLFLRHRSYSLTLRAALTKNLDRLSQIKNIDYLEIMDLALTVNTEEQARFVINSLDMLAKYHETVAPIRSVQVEGTVTAVTKNNTLIIPAPVDYLSWTEELKNFKNRTDAKLFSDRRVLLHGRISQHAGKVFKKLGWKVEHHPKLLEVPFSRL